MVMTTGRIDDAGVSLLDGPNGAALAPIAPGSVVEIKIDDGSGWLVVAVAIDGQTRVGFVDGRFVRTAAPPVGAPEAAPAQWVYAQSTGRMFHVTGGVPVFLDAGYSGNGASENDPDAQAIPLHGPIPRGGYGIGAPEPFKTMANCLPLSPDPGNQMNGRSGFLIHDGRFAGGPHGMTSEGCICLPEKSRLAIWASGDHRLLVVRDDPTPG
jgi:hypothetical protein